MMQGDHARAAASHWRIALIHLKEALTINTRTAPGAAIHTAYYAMFHAALAVLVQHDGPDTTKTHRGVMARYGLLLSASEDGRSQASALEHFPFTCVHVKCSRLLFAEQIHASGRCRPTAICSKERFARADDERLWWRSETDSGRRPYRRWESDRISEVQRFEVRLSVRLRLT
jgi:hypothetical protein